MYIEYTHNMQSIYSKYKQHTHPTYKIYTQYANNQFQFFYNAHTIRNNVCNHYISKCTTITLPIYNHSQ